MRENHLSRLVVGSPEIQQDVVTVLTETGISDFQAEVRSTNYSKNPKTVLVKKA